MSFWVKLPTPDPISRTFCPIYGRIISAIQVENAGATGARPVDVYVAPMGEDASTVAFEIAGELRKMYAVWLEFDQRKLERQIRSASRLGARYTAIIGSDEIAKGVVNIKDMASGEQHEVKRDEILTWLADKCGG